MLETIRQDKYLAAGNHHTYIAPDKKCLDTKAPRGYKPFYIGYYGRHGSRFLTGKIEFISGYREKFDSLHVLGLLTEEGEQLRDWLKWSEEMHRGNEGMLTQTGYEEEKGIGERFARRYRRIFHQKTRKSVRWRSSPVLRSAMTGTSFLLSLQRSAPRLQFDLNAGPRYYFTRWDPNPSLDETENRIADSLFRARFPEQEFWTRMTADSQKSGSILGDTYTAACEIIHILGISRCIDKEADPYALFTEEELFAYAVSQNARIAAWFTHSTETGCYRDTNAGSHLVHEVLARAQEAVDGNDICADLRFGHDSGVAPSLSFLHSEGYDQCTSLSDTYISWPAYKHVTMGCSYAFVLYRNRKGEVLVKLLENEKETTVPALSPFKGPYYRWGDFKAYCEAL
ncbi:MAG: hypothetical protein IJ222_00630 [Bacteroidales bacterium]|nr:hypothetical protein [Bacteroidales bacterium]